MKLDLMWGGWGPCAVAAAVELDVFTAIAPGKTTANEIATAAGADEAMMRRLLDTLVSLKYLARKGQCGRSDTRYGRLRPIVGGTEPVPFSSKPEGQREPPLIYRTSRGRTPDLPTSSGGYSLREWSFVFAGFLAKLLDRCDGRESEYLRRAGVARVEVLTAPTDRNSVWPTRRIR